MAMPKKKTPEVDDETTVPTPVPTPSPEVAKRMEELFRELMEVNTKLVIKVASAECPWLNKCPLYKMSKRIAKIIDELQELREKVGG